MRTGRRRAWTSAGYSVLGAPPHVHDAHEGGGIGMSRGGDGGTGGVPVVHTDDAATKLSDRVHRRCFNCCTTETSTWRRSNLSLGKVLCNKCGLFERTHPSSSRARELRVERKSAGSAFSHLLFALDDLAHRALVLPSLYERTRTIHRTSPRSAVPIPSVRVGFGERAAQGAQNGKQQNSNARAGVRVSHPATPAAQHNDGASPRERGDDGREGLREKRRDGA
ncbi:hypothetical protein FB451DRAFT_1465224 [Mycena latifolia]|nr:hypothetical protein FB451DRAFT_1465224 [Mycena latifolia]